MPSYGQVAARVAADKAAKPDQFCPARRCLWRTRGGHCPRHSRIRMCVCCTPPKPWPHP